MLDSAIQNRKDVHATLETDVYKQFKVVLFSKDLTISEVFNEFASLLVNGDKRCIRIIDNLYMRKIKNKIEKFEKQAQFSEQDQDTIYNLLSAQSKNVDELEDEEDDV